MKIAFAIAMSLLVTAPAIAKDPPADRQNQIVCKGDRTKTLGSNLTGKKICRTRAEWAEMKVNARRELQDISDRDVSPVPSRGGS